MEENPQSQDQLDRDNLLHPATTRLSTTISHPPGFPSSFRNVTLLANSFMGMGNDWCSTSQVFGSGV